MAILNDNTNRIQGLIADISALPKDRYEEGVADGYTKGYGEGLAARTYETWTITLVDGTTIEKEVALL